MSWRSSTSQSARRSGWRSTMSPQDELFVMADRDLIAQAMSNLLDNAVKYTPAGGAIRLAARRTADGEVEMAVVDSGPGIPPEDRERAIERFVRLEQSRSEPGSGLGSEPGVRRGRGAFAAGWCWAMRVGRHRGPGLSVTLHLPAA